MRKFMTGTGFVLVKLAGKEYRFRITLKDVRSLKEKLDGQDFLSAAMSCADDPLSVVNFIWAAGQSLDEPLTEETAALLIDDLITEGWDLLDLTDLVFEICIVSGFFRKAVGDNIRNGILTAFEKMTLPKKTADKEVLQKMEQIDLTKQKTPKN